MERIHPDDGHPFAAVDGEPPRLAEGVHTYRVRRTDGTWVWLDDHHRPERDDTGRIVATQGILFDVSARHELEEARTEALEQERRLARELERTAMAQQTFLRSVSHELRTPLTSVRGFAHTLRDHRTHLDALQTEQLLDRLVANVERLDDQLADLLDLDLGLAPPRREQWVEVDLQVLCTTAVEAMDAADHELVVEVAPEVVRGDRMRLGRAVAGLVRNAVRHTPPGTTVTVWTEGTPDEVTLYVADDGPGVDEEIRETMFQPFVQGQSAATSPRPGAGVGLALAREVATLHGGDVGYREHGSRGSCFHIRLPRNL